VERKRGQIRECRKIESVEGLWLEVETLSQPHGGDTLFAALKNQSHTTNIVTSRAACNPFKTETIWQVRNDCRSLRTCRRAGAFRSDVADYPEPALRRARLRSGNAEHCAGAIDSGRYSCEFLADSADRAHRSRIDPARGVNGKPLKK
jgi:hypothetical protein